MNVIDIDIAARPKSFVKNSS